MTEPLRIAFVPGVTPDKWVRVWRERHPDCPLELTLVEESDQRSVLDRDEADMCLVRLPVERAGLHLIPLYEEQPVVIVAKDHPATAYDEIRLVDLADEQLVAGDVPGWAEICTATRLDFPPMTIKEAVEVVGSGTGIVIVPMSIARLHRRKDVAQVPLVDVATTQIGLAWAEEDEDPRLQDFVGIVRGRRASSSRGRTEPASRKPATARSPDRAASRKPPGKKRPVKARGAPPRVRKRGR